MLSTEDIAEMEKLTVDRLIEAIDAGNLEGAKKLARRMYNEFLSMHDLYRDWTVATLSLHRTALRRQGTRRGDGRRSQGVVAARTWKRCRRGRRICELASRCSPPACKAHLQPLHIEEDDEKIVMQMRPCGSGGRLVLEGKYEGPDAMYTVKGPQLLTYGRENFPVYCAHEPLMELQDIKAHGAPFVVIEPAHEIGKQHCNFIIYKDKARSPRSITSASA